MQIVIIVVDTVISIHALLAESDFMFSVVFYLENIFLSTLSLRRATTCGGGWNEQPRYFYPRSPCGERHGETMPSSRHINYFYPRSPCGERPKQTVEEENLFYISIHALLAESDQWQGG